MNLNKKVFIGFLIFIIIPLFVLGSAVYTVSQQLIEKKYGDLTEVTLQAISRNIYYMFKEANYFSDFWMVKDSIQGIYRTIEVKPNEDSPSSYDLNTLDTLLRGSILTYSPIQSVVIYNNAGKSFSAGRTSGSALPWTVLMKSTAFGQIQELNGSPLWIGPSEYKEFGAGRGEFYQARMVKDFWTMDNLGFMLLKFKFNELDQIFKSYNTNEESSKRYLLVNKSGLIFYDNKQNLEGANVLLLLQGKLDLQQSNHSFQANFQNEKSLVSLYHLNINQMGVRDWSVVSITSWKYVAGEIETIMKLVAGITFICLFFALVYNLVFVRRIIQLILRMLSSMKKVERGDLTTRMEESGKDETSALARGFNSLVVRVEDLLEEVKRQQDRKNKAELMLLQAQIKPHFLFNTLESINVLAIQNQGKKVSQMVYRLGNLLRIGMESREEISLKQELEHLKSYLEIQEFRFEDQFQYEIEAPSELLDFHILKLTLQPLVENILQHGFEPIAYMGLISIKVVNEGERIGIYVTDNGIGISADKLAKFHYKTELETPFHEILGTNEERRGLGVSNVADRIRIQYGSHYGMFICSQEGHGTTMKIVIPKNKGEGL
ncbi:Histidine kinase-, DNA gyrase B-, and HSP90-like ATPase [Paenibacillus sp. yr247]|uniref:sensor histidine kinase n=1 Tax=Paenibacillus sp. yr247 TaxID=1761880 RepID=UPI00088A7762|nr:sensor histidine kinase [Paenibacillus sp. yr247]SDN53613.1 Histidine kinase-, DNA gyrase B-, and HSP90-like ATPase [Paenibacillus sp. yr247]